MLLEEVGRRMGESSASPPSPLSASASSLSLASPTLRRSVPSLSHGRHLSSSPCSRSPSRLSSGEQRRTSSSFREKPSAAMRDDDLPARFSLRRIPTSVSSSSSQEEYPLVGRSRRDSLKNDSGYSTRPASLRSRASSANSNGVEASHIELYLNKRNSRTSLNSNNTGPERERTDSPTGTVASRTSSSSMRDSAPPSRGSRVITVQPAEPRSVSPPPASEASRNGDEEEVEEIKEAVTPFREDPSQSGDLLVTRGEPLTSPLLVAKNIYGNDIVWQIDATVYCGGKEAVSDMTLLCRLEIDCIVDLGGDDDDGYRRKGDSMCLCSRRTRHSRTHMVIKVPEDERAQTNVNMIGLFEDFVTVVGKAAKQGKCVLVHSPWCRSRAPAFAAAYIMHKLRCTRMNAIQRISEAMNSKRPAVCIADHLQRALMRWQSSLGIKAADSNVNAALFSIKPRTAWT